MTPIICLSKNRADPKLAKTLALASEAPKEFRENFHVLIERQECEAYVNTFPKLPFQFLPLSNQGLAYARQYALEYFYGLRTPFWMVDDDISKFGLVAGSAVHSQPIEKVFARANQIIELAQEALGAERVLGQAAMEYQQFAWSSMKDVKWRGYCDVAVWINAPVVKDFAAYRPEMVLKEDRDFTLQVLASGCETARLCRIAFAAPKNGSNAGGLKDLYASQGREETAVNRMVAAWQGVVTKQLKTDGRIDCKIDWKKAFKNSSSI